MATMIRCGIPHDNEVDALDEIDYVLTNDRDWIIIANIGAHQPELKETDVLLVGKKGVVAVELKYWQGTITSRINGLWQVIFPNGATETRLNPLGQARSSAIKIKKLFEDHGIDGKDFFVSYLVVTTHPRSELVTSGPTIGSLAISCRKFRRGLDEHIKTHQRDCNQRNYNRKHISRLLHALDIAIDDIGRSLDYLFGEQRVDTVQTACPSRTTVSDTPDKSPEVVTQPVPAQESQPPAHAAGTVYVASLEPADELIRTSASRTAAATTSKTTKTNMAFNHQDKASPMRGTIRGNVEAERRVWELRGRYNYN